MTNVIFPDFPRFSKWLAILPMRDADRPYVEYKQQHVLRPFNIDQTHTVGRQSRQLVPSYNKNTVCEAAVGRWLFIELVFHFVFLCVVLVTFLEVFRQHDVPVLPDGLHPGLPATTFITKLLLPLLLLLLLLRSSPLLLLLLLQVMWLLIWVILFKATCQRTSQSHNITINHVPVTHGTTWICYTSSWSNSTQVMFIFWLSQLQ